MSNDINIAKLAQLTNLDLDESQQTVLHQELSEILTLINQLQEVNTDHTAPLSHPPTLLLMTMLFMMGE